MRRKVTEETLRKFMRELAAAARSPGRVYFTGGATALLLGFREQTIDIDLKLDPEPKGVFEAIGRLKNELDVNVELASPADFIPVVPDWRRRSQPIDAIGQLEFFHYDFVLQALAKLERGHERDLKDVSDFLRGGYITTESIKRTFAKIEPGLPRYPAVSGEQFRRRVDEFLAKHKS